MANEATGWPAPKAPAKALAVLALTAATAISHVGTEQSGSARIEISTLLREKALHLQSFKMLLISRSGCYFLETFVNEKGIFWSRSESLVEMSGGVCGSVQCVRFGWAWADHCIQPHDATWSLKIETMPVTCLGCAR